MIQYPMSPLRGSSCYSTSFYNNDTLSGFKSAQADEMIMENISANTYFNSEGVTY